MRGVLARTPLCHVDRCAYGGSVLGSGRAVLAAYAATDPAGHWCEDWAAVFTETGPGQPLPPNHPLTQQRADVEKEILENLLRLNHERAGKD